MIYVICHYSARLYSAHILFHPVSSIFIGLAYLEAKGKEEGVVTLPSGLMYKEVRPGNGKLMMQADCFAIDFWFIFVRFRRALYFPLPPPHLTNHFDFIYLADGKTPTVNSPCEW